MPGAVTARRWHVVTLIFFREFKLGTAVEDMQVGCLWQGNNILTVSLSGYINYLDRTSPAAPKRIVKVIISVGIIALSFQ